jgi:VWFA-related protein
MNAKAFLALMALFCIVVNGLAQSQLPPAPPVPAQRPPQDSDDVVKITTNLVQVDAVVTKDGRQVPNLKAEDFEIFEDGKRQTITSFAYIANVPANPTPAATTAKAEERDESVPFVPLKRDDPRRTIAIVVDDLGLSAESMGPVRSQLRKFVNQQMQPHDLVAIIRTGMEIGALQQFTNDKRLLSRAVDQLRWNACSRVGMHVLAPAYGPYVDPVPNRADNARTYASIPDNSCGGRAYYSTFQAIQHVIEALAEIPGRKSMMVLSDSMPVEDQGSDLFWYDSLLIQTQTRTQALRRIAEMAIRASVVIYSIDTQGLQPTGITAADSGAGNLRMAGDQSNSLMASRARMLFDRRAGGEMIARQTGGFQIKNSNDFKLDRVLEDQSGYYLIGYRPTDETFNQRFHKITAKVKRSGMQLRTRYGFFGFSEEDTVIMPKSRTNMALMSPFGAQDISVDFTSFFANDKTAGSLVRSFLYLNPKDLTFEVANDRHEAKIELHGVIFGANGVPVEQVKHNAIVSMPGEQYELALREGIRIRFDMPAKKPGAYQVRVAARDVASARLGAAGQFVLVPDLTNKRLAASGIVLRGVSNAQATGGLEPTVASPAVRRFAPNSDLYSAFVIYNATLDKLSQQPNLKIENKLFRDGKRVFAYPEVAVDAANQADLDRLLVTLQFRLGADLEPGHYYLQFVITDKLKPEQPPVIQWVDFEIVSQK